MRTITTRALTTGELLRENGIACQEKDLILPKTGELLKPRDIVTVRRCVPVEIRADGRSIKTEHHSLEAEEIVRAAGLDLGPLDRIAGEIDKTHLPVRIEVIRVEESVLTREELIPYETVQTLSPELPRGRVQLLQEGEEGLEERTYLIHYENGQEIGREMIKREVKKEAVPEVKAVGIKNTIVLTSRSLIRPLKTLVLEATAYTHTGNTTYTGVYPRVGTIAVDPKVIPLGTRMWVEGYGYGIAQDTGGLIKGNIIDLFMNSEEECWRWGRRKVTVYLFK